MTIKWKIDTSKLQSKVQGLRAIMPRITPYVHQEFIRNTPVKSGYARSRTSLSGRVITARYPYAAVLDAGRGFRDGRMRGSTQAPEGMTKPTRDFAIMMIQSAIRQLRGK